jgi:hypothetical protein
MRLSSASERPAKITRSLAREPADLGGRPQIETELRVLIRRMKRRNSALGAPRIHGELLKLGFEVAQSSVAKHMDKRRRPPARNGEPSCVTARWRCRPTCFKARSDNVGQHGEDRQFWSAGHVTASGIKLNLDRIKPKRHLIIDGEFFARPDGALGKHINKQLIDMPYKIAVGLERVAQQTGVTKGNGRSTPVTV